MHGSKREPALYILSARTENSDLEKLHKCRRLRLTDLLRHPFLHIKIKVITQILFVKLLINFNTKLGNFSFCKLSAADVNVIRTLENKYKSPAGTQTNTYLSHFSIFSICLFFFLDVQRTVRMCANCCEWVKISAGTVQAQLQSPHGYQRPRKQGIAVLPGIGDYL